MKYILAILMLVSATFAVAQPCCAIEPAKPIPANAAKFIAAFPALVKQQSGDKDYGKCEAKLLKDADGPVNFPTPEGLAPVVEASCDGLPLVCYYAFHPDPEQDLSAVIACDDKAVKQRVDTE